MYSARVLAFAAVLVGLAHSFPWDIVVGTEKRLEFFYNGTVTHIEDIPSAHSITAVTYDPVHYRVLFVGYDDKKWSTYSYDLTTRNIKTLLMRQLNLYDYMYLAYDPLTQLLFWTEDYKIYSLSLEPALSKEAFDGNLLVTLNYYCTAIAVDSCGGYIYWATGDKIERAAFDGSKREVLINSEVYRRRSLAIDRQTEKIYWIDAPKHDRYSVESADLNGKNRRTFYFKRTDDFASALTVSKNFIYWKSYDQKAILQLPKNQKHGVAPVVYSQSSRVWYWCHLIAANYTIEEQTSGNKSCEALKKSLIPDGEERNGAICHNYCFQGNCSVSAEGHPKCICEAGYSGERCEVNACHMYCLHGGVCSLNEEEEPVCQCTADYEGERCAAASHTSVCNNMTQQLLDLRSEVKQYREELQSTLQLYSATLNENAAKIQKCEESKNSDTLNENTAKNQKCEESKKDDLLNHDETTIRTQTSNNMKF